MLFAGVVVPEGWRYAVFAHVRLGKVPQSLGFITVVEEGGVERVVRASTLWRQMVRAESLLSW